MQVVFKRSRYQNMHAAVYGYMIVITVVFLDTCTTCSDFVESGRGEKSLGVCFRCLVPSPASTCGIQLLLI